MTQQPENTKTIQKHILITGAGSYLGESFAAYAKEHYPNIRTESISLHGDAWKGKDFGVYDAVFHVAGKAHADVGKLTEEEQAVYYAVNTDLAIETAKKAKADGVRQFIFMSSMSIYGDSAPFGEKKVIDRETKPQPTNCYGRSKWLADQGIRELEDADYHVAVIRAPMIYGRDAKGNYQTLAKIARHFSIFPAVQNERSMLYVDNLSELICQLVICGRGGIYYPQNKEYSNTTDMVKLIGKTSGKEVHTIGLLNPAVTLADHIPGKISRLTNKAFGNNVYDKSISQYEGLDYQRYDLAESIRRTEGAGKMPEPPAGSLSAESGTRTSVTAQRKPHLLVISQYFYPETFRVNDMASEWVKRGYKVTVLTGIPNYPMGHFFDGYGYNRKRRESRNGMDIIRIPLIPRGNSRNKLFNSLGMAANYLSFVLSGFFWNLTTDIKADLVFSYEVSPMTQVLIGCRYARKHHVPHFLYVQDLWPENVETVTGITNPVIIHPIDRMVDKIYRQTDQIFTTSPSFVKAITNRRNPVPKKKVHCWPQYAEEFYRPLVTESIREEAVTNAEQGKDDPVSLLPTDHAFTIAFAGNIGTAQGLDILPKAASIIKKQCNRQTIRFIIVGDGRYQDFLEESIRKEGVEDTFTFIPRQSAEQIPRILACCEAAFVSFADTKLWENTIPAKLQSYMACGMPILAAAGGETKRIIDEAECGICVPIGDAQALAEAILDWSEKASHDPAWSAQMKKNSRSYSERVFNKKHRMDQMERMIQKYT